MKLGIGMELRGVVKCRGGIRGRGGVEGRSGVKGRGGVRGRRELGVKMKLMSVQEEKIAAQRQ